LCLHTSVFEHFTPTFWMHQKRVWKRLPRCTGLWCECPHGDVCRCSTSACELFRSLSEVFLRFLHAVQPFSQKPRTLTVAKECQIGLYDTSEADLALVWNSWSAGFLRERLYLDTLVEPLASSRARVSRCCTSTGFSNLALPPLRLDGIYYQPQERQLSLH